MKQILNLITIGLLSALTVYPEKVAASGFQNGGFEDGTLSSWTIESGQTAASGIITWNANIPLWPAAVIIPKTDYADFYNAAFSTPFDGNYMARINEHETLIDNSYSIFNSFLGGQGHATRLSQTATISSSGTLYIDWGAVLEEPEPMHAENLNPFVEILVERVSDGAVLYHMCHYSPDPGWLLSSKPSTGNELKVYTHAEQLQVPVQLPGGQPVQILVAITAADCGYDAHGGYAYIDGVGMIQPTPPPASPTLTGVKNGNTTTLTIKGYRPAPGTVTKVTVQHPKDRCPRLDVWENAAEVYLDPNGQATVNIDNGGNRWDIYRASDEFASTTDLNTWYSGTTYPGWGYVTKTLIPGVTVALANPFIQANNNLSALFPATPDFQGTKVQTLNPTSGWITSTYLGNPSWDTDVSLSPGQGCLVTYGGTANFDLVLSGAVSEGALSCPLGIQNNFISQLTAQSGGVLGLLGNGRSDANGDSLLPLDSQNLLPTIYRWNSDIGWIPLSDSSIDQNDLWPEIGEPFFCNYANTPASPTWSRYFSLWKGSQVAPHIADGNKNGASTTLQIHCSSDALLHVQHANTASGSQKLVKWTDVDLGGMTSSTPGAYTLTTANGGSTWDVYRIYSEDTGTSDRNNSGWGYVTEPLSSGLYTSIANPFHQNNNKLSALFPATSDFEGTEVLKWDPAGQWICSSYWDGQWDNDLTLSPGDGVLGWTGAQNAVLVFSGQVPTGALGKKLGANNVISQLTSQAGGIFDNCSGLPAGTGRTIYRGYDSTGQTWSPITSDQTWPGIGTTFACVYTGTPPTSWVRDFNIWTIVPIAPSGLSYTSDATKVQLYWNDCSGNEDHFAVYRKSGGDYVLIGTAPANCTTYTDTSITAGSVYSYVITAVNCVGESENSNEATGVAIPCRAPTAFSAYQISSTKFTASWSSSSGATEYRLEVATDSGFSQDVYNASVGKVYSFTVQSLSPNTTYYYRVRAYNGTDSAPSGVVTVKTAPAAPAAGPTSGVTATGFTANWSASPGAASYYLDVATYYTFDTFVTGYNSVHLGNQTSCTITGLLPNVTYYYRVRATSDTSGTNGAGAISDNSVTVAAAPNQPPSTPVPSAATQISSTSFTANWNSSGAAAYWLEVATDSGFTHDVYHSSVGNVLSFTVQSLSPNTTYYYRVQAFNGFYSGQSTVITAKTAPAAPNAGSGTQITSAGFTANWNASTGATAYWLEVSTDSGFSQYVYNSSVGNVYNFTVQSLSANTTYYYRVRASNGTYGPTSSVITVKTAPAPPVSNAATSISRSGFTANWSASTGATSYYLDVATYYTFTTFVSGYNSVHLGNQTSCVVTGLSPNVTYYYRVRATSDISGTNGAGAISLNSGTVAAQTNP